LSVILGESRTTFIEKIKKTRNMYSPQSQSIIDDIIEIGKEIGKEMARDELQREFVINLLLNENYDFSVETIASLAAVSEEFVVKVKDELENPTDKPTDAA
jgi:hypothetical protein